MGDYIIAFSSFYKANYANEILYKNRIRGQVGKTPPNIFKSCGYGIYIRTNNIGAVQNLLINSNIDYRGVLKIEKNMDGESVYRAI